MAERVFCIDFGSGYTKVGLRTAPTADTELLSDPTALAGGVEFCVPSAVWAEQRGDSYHYEFGFAAFGRPPGDRVKLFTNWKRWAFEAGSDTPVGIDALLGSADFAALAGKYQVPLTQVRHLQKVMQYARGLAGVDPAAVAESWNVRKARVLAVKFFAHLRGFVLDACRRLPDLSGVEEIPVVLAVPAFAPEAELAANPGVKLLLRALDQAGWRVREGNPVLSEPLANAVGVLTNGTNSLKTTKGTKSVPSATCIDLGKMFGRGPFNTAMKDGKTYPLYRTLVVDVGAFTTDVAVVELPTAELMDCPTDAVRVRQQSAAVGVSELDREVAELLPSNQREYLADRMSARDWEDFRVQVYSDPKEKPFRTGELDLVTKAERPAVRAAVEGFGKRWRRGSLNCAATCPRRTCRN